MFLISWVVIAGCIAALGNVIDNESLIVVAGVMIVLATAMA